MLISLGTNVHHDNGQVHLLQMHQKRGQKAPGLRQLR